MIQSPEAIEFATSVLGIYTPIALTAGLTVMGFFMRRAIQRSDARNEVVDRLVAEQSASATKVDNIAVVQTNHDQLLKTLGDTTIQLNTLLTAHLEYAGDRNDYIQNRLDTLGEKSNRQN